MASVNTFNHPDGGRSGGASANPVVSEPIAERGIPPVNGRSFRSRAQMFFMAAGLVLLVVLMWLIITNQPAPAKYARDDNPKSTSRFDEIRPGTVAAPPPPNRVLVPPEVPAPRNEPPIQVIPKPVDPKPAGKRELTPLEKRMQSKTIVSSTDGGATSIRVGSAHPPSPAPPPGLPGLSSLLANRGFVDALPGANSPADAAAGQRTMLAPGPGRAAAARDAGQTRPGAASDSGDDAQEAEDRQHSIAGLLRPTQLSGVSATRIPSRTLMVARGKMIDCVLDTAISSMVAGMTRCTLPHDIYSDDGKVILLDRGTELTGEYRSSVATGQTRLGVIWSRAKTPNGVLIDLNSPATDTLGRSGLEGLVDTRFWERYGAALLLSVLDDGLQLAIANASRGGVYVAPNSTRTGRDAVQTVLQHNLQIRPVIVVNQGEPVSVFVARDLDFRSVYGYRPGARG